MAIFGSQTQSTFGRSTTSGYLTNNKTTATIAPSNAKSNANPDDIDVPSPPTDSVSCIRFSPTIANSPDFMVAGSWDNSVRCWQVHSTGQSTAKAEQSMQGPVLDCAWHDDGTKVFIASADKQVKCWDLASNQAVQVAQHNAPVKLARWVKAPNYSALMTGSWDASVKFWDLRSPNPILSMDMNGNRVYAGDVIFPVAVVGLSNNTISIINLQDTPKEMERRETIFKSHIRCVSLFKDKRTWQPTALCAGSANGRGCIQYLESINSSRSFNFKCHRSATPNNPSGVQDVYVVNDMACHPQHQTMATVGGDGAYIFWDQEARSRLKSSDQMDQSITCCAFAPSGRIFAYALGYDWAKGHAYSELNNPASTKKPRIRFNSCYDAMTPKPPKT